MKRRWRIARLIALISFLFSLLAFTNEGANSFRAYQTTRAILQQNETESARVTASALQHLLQAHGETETTAYIASRTSGGNKHNLAVILPDGTAAFDQPGGQLAHPPSPEELSAVRGQPAISRWLPGGSRLQILVPIQGPEENPLLFVVSEVDLQPAVDSILASLWIRILFTFLSTLLALSALIIISWRLAVQPMNAISAAALQATGGDLTPRVSRTPLTELDNIGQGLNSLLDRVQFQTNQLEAMNRELEASVRARTAALTEANQSLTRQGARLARQADGLQALNRILSAAVSYNSLEDLAAKVLSEAVSVLEAEFGALTILNTQVYYTPGEDAAPRAGPPPPDLLRKMTESPADAGVIVPILAQGITSGQIYLHARTGGNLDENETTLLTLIGQQLGAAAVRIQAFELSRATNRLMSRLLQVSEELNQRQTYADRIAFIGSSTLELSGAERGVFMLINPENQLTPVWHHGVSTRFIRELTGSGRETGAFIPPGDSNPVQVPNLEQISERQSAWWRQNGEGIHSLALLPLVYEGRLSAFLAVFYTQPDTPGFSHPEILEAFARQSAIALENARLIEAERQQRELAEALLDVSAAITSTLDQDEIFERILVNLERVIQHDAASIMLVEADELRVIRTKGYPNGDKNSSRINYPAEMFPEVVRMSQTGLVRIIPDTHADPDWVDTPGTRWIMAYAGAPVRVRGSLVGVINLAGRKPGLFSPNQASILQAFATHAALALDNARQYQSTLSSLDETDSLYRALTGLLTAGGDVRQIAEKIAQTLTSQLDVGHCSVSVVNHETQMINIISTSGYFGVSLPRITLDGQGLTALAARDGKPIYVPDVRQDPHYLEGAQETCTEFVIPLASTQGQIIAVINMEDQKRDAFSEKTRRVIMDFANRAALVFENAVLLDTARQQSRRAALLNEIAQSCLEESSVALSLQEIVRQVVELTAVDSCSVELWDETRSVNAPAADWWDGKDTIELDPEGSYEQAVTRLVMQRQEPVVYPDLREDAPPGAFFSRYGSRSILGIPLSANGMWLGAILVGRAAAAPFRQAAIDLLRQAAVQIALGVAKTRLVEETRRRFEESEKLRQATAALATQLDFERVIALIAEHLPRLLQFDTLAVFHVRQNVIRPMLAVNLPIAQRLDSALFPRDDPFFKDLARQKSPLVLDAAAAETRYRALGGRDSIRCWAALPLFTGEEVAGSIEVGRLQREPFTPNEMLLLQVFSNQVSAALQNATLHGIEQQLATTDHLTGLYNRRGFIDLAHHEMERCWRFHRPVCLLMIDIDHFKQVNDHHSHIAGDAVLVQLAALMRNTLREVDIICRYGGEEFCVMLPESDPHGARHVAERLRQAVQANTFLYRETEIRITISLGMSAFAGLNQSLEELIERADKALMTSKQEGRNRVTQG